MPILHWAPWTGGAVLVLAEIRVVGQLTVLIYLYQNFNSEFLQGHWL